MKTNLLLAATLVLAAAPARASIESISIPENSQDSSCAPRDQGIWSATAPLYPFQSNIGIGHLVSDPGVGWGGFAMHDHVYVASNVPDPMREVVTFHFNSSTIVKQLEIIQHANGVTKVEGFAGDDPDNLVSIGNVFGPSGDVTGGGALPEGGSQVFDFGNTTVAGTCFRFVVTKTPLEDGFALYRAFPRDTDGQRIAATLPAHVISVSDLDVAESAGTATFTVTVTPPSDEEIQIHYATASGSAAQGTDFTATEGTLTIPAHAASAEVPVPIQDDALPELAESFVLNLSDLVGSGTGLARTQASCTILESDIDPLTWDDGATDDGTTGLTKNCVAATDYWFRIQAQSADSGGWRTVLRVASGSAQLYAGVNFIPSTGSFSYSSTRPVGDNGLLFRPDQYSPGPIWYYCVHAGPNTTFTLFSGDIHIEDLGTLGWVDANANGQYDIGETALPSGSGPTTVKGEGVRFWKASVPVGTPAWSLWMNGDPRLLAVHNSTPPYPDVGGWYDRQQGGRLLLVPPYLGTGTNTYYLSVAGNPGDAINLDSRIQEVQDLAFDTDLTGVNVAGPPFRVYRTQVPIDQIAWDVTAQAVAGDPNIAVRHGDVAGEFDNQAYSAAPGAAADNVTLVPDFLTNGTWFITVWGGSPYTFNLHNGNPTITPLAFHETVVNDQPNRAGWRFYGVTDIPSQAGSLGWELELSDQVPGTQIALRKNKVPGRWQYRTNGSDSVYDTNASYTDYSSTAGFLQRPGHQADIWYVGVFLPQAPLGAFTLDVHPIVPSVAGIDPTNTAISGLEPGRWKFLRYNVPAGLLGWDIRLADPTGSPQFVVRRDILPNSVGNPGWWSDPPPSNPSWPSGAAAAGRLDWTGRLYDAPETTDFRQLRQIFATGRPLEEGTYYVGVFNPGADPLSCTVQSRAIGSGLSYPVADLAFNGGVATVSDLAPREAAYFKTTIPEGTPSWEITLSPTAGEMLLLVRRDAIPSLEAVRGTDIQSPDGYSTREVKVQKTDAERYALLPPNGQSTLVAGDYYLAVVSEGVDPADDWHTGTGTCSGTLTSVGPLAVTDLGAATSGGVGGAVSLASGQVKAYSFTVPTGTASLEVRLDNRVGEPLASVVPGTDLPRPHGSYYWWLGYESYGFGNGRTNGTVQDDNLITIPNPTPGAYRLVVRAAAASNNPAVYPAAGADLVVIANSPVPVAFDGGTAAVADQMPTAWRYFEVTVPTGAVGWDVRVRDVTGGAPQVVVSRETLPPAVNTDGPWPNYPSYSTAWPSGCRWAWPTDWTGRPYEAGSWTSLDYRRLVMGGGMPLEAGTYIIGVYNADQSNPTSYVFESRTFTATAVSFLGGTATVTGLPPRDAAVFKVTVPENTPSWEFTLDPTVGEMCLLARRGAMPDFTAERGGFLQYDGTNREVKVAKPGPERYVLLPLDGQDSLTPGDYYLAVVAEGVDPEDATHTGTGTCSGLLTSVGPLAVTDLGTASVGGTTTSVSLAGGQVRACEVTVAPGTAALEIRMDNQVGLPLLSFVGGTRTPQPHTPYVWPYGGDNYGTGGGTTTGRAVEDSLLTIPNPAPGTYRLTVRAGWTPWLGTEFSPASTDLVVRALPTPTLAFDGGAVTVSGHLATGWRYYQVTVPAGIMGWDLRLSHVTGGDPLLVVCRDTLPTDWSSLNFPNTPSYCTTWPSGAQWAAPVTDWTGREFDAGSSATTHYRRLLAASGRPLEAGTYFVGIYNNDNTNPASYWVESRGLGSGQTYSVADFGFVRGSETSITALDPREAAYFHVTVPAATPSWEFTLETTVGESLLCARRGAIPDFNSTEGSDTQADSDREVRVSKTGNERYVMLPPPGSSVLLAGDYYLAVVGEGESPADASHTGTGTSSSTLASEGSLDVTDLSTASPTPSTTPVSLAAGQFKEFTFTVPPDTDELQLRLENRTGYPCLAVARTDGLVRPFSSRHFWYYWYEVYGQGGGQISDDWHLGLDSITLANPTPGTYSLAVRASGSAPQLTDFTDATADLVIQTVGAPPPETPDPLNFDVSQNGNGHSHTDSRQLADGQHVFYEVPVPAMLGSDPVIGWKILVNHLEGASTLRIFKTWGHPEEGITIAGGVSIIVPPFLTPGDTWYVEVEANGLTNYTITSQPVVLAHPAWTLPAGHNSVFADTGSAIGGDHGTDLGQGDWHFYAVDIPDGNAGLLRTELDALNGNPDLYIRADGVPTTDHRSTGVWGAYLYERSLTGSGTEYGNWVPWDGRSQHELPPGRWILGVKAAGTSNARYRLIVSTGTVTPLDIQGGSAGGQVLVSKDWRCYQFTVPEEAPATWNLTFSQEVGDVVMWLRDTVPPGNRTSTDESWDGYGSGLVSWRSDWKNNGPYPAGGYDTAGTHSINTPPLRPGHTYYAGFRASSDATFSISSATTGTIGVVPELDFYTGTITVTVPPGGSSLCKVPVPTEAVRWRHTSTHSGNLRIRIEQGAPPLLSGSVHREESWLDSSWSTPLTEWPWLPGYTWYVCFLNDGAEPEEVTFTLSGRNALTDDVDNDGLPDYWEVLHFGNIWAYGPADDPDGDGNNNATELADNTDPTDAGSARYPLALAAIHGTATADPPQPSYAKGSTVAIEAQGSPGYSFQGWIGGPFRNSDFAVHATATLTVPTEGYWTFGTNSSDGVRVTVGGTTVIQSDGPYGQRENYGPIWLPAGPTTLDVVYYQAHAESSLELFAAPGTFYSWDPSFRLVGDTVHGGLEAVCDPGDGSTSGLLVRQVLARSYTLDWLFQADALLAGALPSCAETTVVCPTLNFLAYEVGDGKFSNNAPFPLSAPQAQAAQTILIDDSYSLTGVFSLPYSDVLDTTGLVWTSGGSAPWYGENSTGSFDGVDRACSGPIGNSGTSTLRTTVTGPGQFDFHWKVSSQIWADLLSFSIDGVQMAAISGEVDWEARTFALGAGLHTLEWTYAKSAYDTSGSDQAWLDQIQFTPVRYTLTIHAGAGSVQRDPDLADYAPGQTVTLTAQAPSGQELIMWTGDATGNSNPVQVVMDGDKDVAAWFGLPLAAALDNTLAYTTSDPPWFGQTATTHDGIDAARSTPIGSWGQCWVETTVAGPGTLTFWWKVSSEAGWDWLEFYLDGALQPGRISGETDWTQQTITVRAGSHTLRWRYTKDSGVDIGQDCGWLDQVVFTPTPTGTTYTSWAATRFTPEELADPAISGPAANPTLDGINNLLKYACHLDPHTAYVGEARYVTPGTGIHGLPSVTTLPSRVLRVEYLQRTGTLGLTYRVEFCSDPGAEGPDGWQPSTETPVESPTGNPNWTRVVIEDNPPMGATKRFARVVVTQEP